MPASVFSPFDSIAELEKLAPSAPGARVFSRILIENKGAEWPLTRKFGCASHMAIDLLAAAKRLNLRPVGLSVHVGWQQTDPQQWKAAIALRSKTLLPITIDRLQPGCRDASHNPIEIYPLPPKFCDGNHGRYA